MTTLSPALSPQGRGSHKAQKFSKNSLRLLVCLAVSLCVHLVLFWLFKEHWGLGRLSTTTPPETVWIKLKNTPPESIVDMAKPETEVVPDNPSAQSLYNQKVAEETVQKPLSKTESAPPQPVAKKPETPKVTAKKTGPSFDELYGKKPEPERIPGMPESAQPVATHAMQDDFLPQYKYGDRTYINTLANPQIGYFVELKSKFRLAFNPAHTLRGQANQVAQGQISVVLGVSVGKSGQLADLVVIRPSGLPGYDNEGLRTVRVSAPFTAPPVSLLGPDGQLHMAWTFVVYL